MLSNGEHLQLTNSSLLGLSYEPSNRWDEPVLHAAPEDRDWSACGYRIRPRRLRQRLRLRARLYVRAERLLD